MTEDYQKRRLTASRLTVFGGTVNPSELLAALDDLCQDVEQIYLHGDLDVLDTSVGHANPYAAAGGPDLAGVLTALTETQPIRGAGRRAHGVRPASR